MQCWKCSVHREHHDRQRRRRWEGLEYLPKLAHTSELFLVDGTVSGRREGTFTEVRSGEHQLVFFGEWRDFFSPSIPTFFFLFPTEKMFDERGKKHWYFASRKTFKNCYFCTSPASHMHTILSRSPQLKKKRSMRVMRTKKQGIPPTPAHHLKLRVVGEPEVVVVVRTALGLSFSPQGAQSQLCSCGIACIVFSLSPRPAISSIYTLPSGTQVGFVLTLQDLVSSTCCTPVMHVGV